MRLRKASFTPPDRIDIRVIECDVVDVALSGVMHELRPLGEIRRVVLSPRESSHRRVTLKLAPKFCATPPTRNEG